uniref:(northern house mosquito) hypothetical protein n=1 Tax=Culex pipiens TaxID=7175 RepID=A0A8D8FQ29_CULPI
MVHQLDLLSRQLGNLLAKHFQLGLVRNSSLDGRFRPRQSRTRLNTRLGHPQRKIFLLHRTQTLLEALASFLHRLQRYVQCVMGRRRTVIFLRGRHCRLRNRFFCTQN